MRIANNINGAPKTEFENTHGVHSDENSFYFFDSDIERENFIASIPIVWNKEAHIAEVNAAQEQLYRDTYQSLGYLNGWEISFAAQDNNCEYQQEAKDLINWWWKSWAILEEYFSKVTEETAMSIDDVMKLLPKFINPSNWDIQ